MTDVTMPNGDLVNFPDEMPAEQIKSLIASKFPDEVAALTQPKKEPYTGTILPIHRDENGNLSPAVPTFLQGLLDSGAAAVTAPYRAMTGQLPMTDDSGRTSMQAINEAGNIAMLGAAPTSIAAGTGAEIARNAGVGLLNKAEQAAVSPRNELLQSAARLNVKLPVAVASDKASVQQMGKTIANVPIVGQPLRKSARDAISQLDTAATKIQNDLGAGSPAVAGNAAKEGITNYAKNTLSDAVKAKYDAVDALISQNVTSPLAETTKIATDISARRANAALPGSAAVNMIQQAISRDGGLNYQGIKTLRTRIGEMLENPSVIPSDTSQAELKQIYGSLSSDLKTSVERSGGKQALSEFEKANNYAASVAKEREALNKVLGTKSDEGIFDKITSLANNSSRADISTLMKVKTAVSKDTWDEIASGAIARMGRDAEGGLTPDRFITAYGKMSESGKSLLFGKDTRQSLDDIAKVSSRFKQLNQYANPSGTGQTVLGGALGTGAILSPLTAIKVAIPGYITAKILARPAAAKTVADYMKAYELAAKIPGARTQGLLNQRAREVASVAANNNQASAADIFSKLSSVQKGAADQNNQQQVGQPETQPQANDPAEDFSRAYLQGNGA